MTRRFKRGLFVVAIIGVAFLGVTAMIALKPSPPKKETSTLAPLVDTLELERMSSQFTVRSQGTVRPRTQTVLSAEVAGTITEMSPKFIPGGVFEAGETLMRIDPTNYLVALEQAEALVEQREIEFNGAKKLLDQGYRAQSEFASAAAALASAKAELTRARRDLQRTYIRLPYGGMVRDKETDLGQFVSPGSRLGVVFATDHAEVRLPLTDQDLAFVDLPQMGEIAGEGPAPGPMVTLTAIRKGEPQQWQARIVRTEGVVDETSRVTYAVARIDDPYRLDGGGEPLPIGTFVTATIDGIAVEGLIRVPRNIIRGANKLVFVDDESRLRIREVRIVRADADYAYIGAGAAPGERVVVTSLESPVNGMAVRTETADESPASRVASAEDDEEAP